LRQFFRVAGFTRILTAIHTASISGLPPERGMLAVGAMAVGVANGHAVVGGSDLLERNRFSRHGRKSCDAAIHDQAGA
jgi:hypothetical protein